MAPQQPRSFDRRLPGGFTPRYPGRGTAPLAGEGPPGVPGGCTTKGCQQPLPPGECPLFLASPAAAYDNKARAAFVPGKKRFSLSRGA